MCAAGLSALFGLSAAMVGWGQTATWIGGNTFRGYGGATNWSTGVVPLGTNYTVIVPDSSSLVYDVTSNGVIDALSFGAGSALRMTNQRSLTVNGPALVKGQIEAGGAGSAFRARTNTTVLSDNPRLFASDGGQIVVGASSYGWNRYNAASTLLSAVGSGSLVDLKNVNSMIVSYGDGGSWTYRIVARTNGIIDLSGLSQITAPGQDDWLQFDVDSGGGVRLDGLRRMTGRSRFNVDAPLFELPLLESASETYFNLSSNTTLRLPALSSYSSADFTVGPNSTVRAAQLVSLDSVAINLSDNAAFVATNLNVYRNSAIPIAPGRNFQPGLLADIYGSLISVSGGATFRAGPLTYDVPGDWRASPTLFAVGGVGSVLDLSTLKALQVRGGWGGSWTYSILVNSNGVLNLSGLETVAGGEDNYDNDDWLAFTVRNGGDLRLDALREITRRTRFNLENPRFDFPALQTASGATFNLSDGSLLNAPNLTRLEGCAFNFGFNSRFSAPKLDTMINTPLAISPGVVVSAPSFTNVFASRFSVSGGTTLTIGAPSYDTYSDWRTHLTLFSADGTGSLLDLSAMRTLQTQGGHSGAWSHTVIANNNGVIDLSGLETAIGARTDTFNNDDWLAFTLRNGGDIRLDALRQTTRRTQFNIEVPFYELPSLETSDNTAFNLADGSELDLPVLRALSSCSIGLGLNSRLSAPTLTNLYGGSVSLGLNSTLDAPDLFSWDSCSITLGLNSTCNIPNLLSFRNTTLALSPGRTFHAPPFTNIYGSILQLSGGSVLHVAAPDYDVPGDWRWSPTLFLADGAGTRLDLAAVKTLQIYGGWGGAWTYSITANNGGIVDLSGLETATGARTDAYDNDDWLAFNVQGNGDLKLDSLRTITRRTRVNIAVPEYDLPSLESADNTLFTMSDGAHLALPSLTNLDSSSFTFGYNNTIDAPKLRNFTGSTLSLTADRSFHAPPFTNVYSSRFAVNGGSVLHLAPPTYDLWNDWRTSATLFSADGAGSLIEAAALKWLRIPGAHGGAWTYSVVANNGGTIDFSGLDTVIGADPSNWSNDDWLAFNAATASTIKFGNASVTRRAAFAAAGLGTRLDFAGLYLRAPATLNVNTRAVLGVKGNLGFENTDPNSIVVEGAAVQMDGAQPQVLEVGGKNLGPTGASARNFGYSQLIVGASNRTSIVRLQDAINNGQRGPSGESEALYLYGLDGQGLRLLNDSKLIFNNVPVYALLGGQMRRLNDLVSPATNSIAFDDGILADAAGPKILSLSPAQPVTPPLSSIEVTFDIPIQAATFTTADVRITGPNGTIVPTGVAPVSGNTYRVSFAAQTASGAYSLEIGPAINEAAENLAGMDQDGDGLGGEAADDVFRSSFTLDGWAPMVVSALALQNGTRVGVTFDEPVPASVATNPATYLVNGIVPARAVLQTNGTQVALWVGTLVGESFTLTVNNLADGLGNTTNRTLAGALLTMDMRDIGSPGSNPRETGATLTFNGADFEMISGGSDFYWNGSDAGHFAFEARPGDFDVRVQVARIDRQETYSQAGIMWRESTAANARRVYACLNDPNSYNRYWALIRYNPGEGGTEFPGSPGPGIGSLPAWVRLQRVGNVFVAYRGTDGTNWTEYGRVTTSFPAGGLVGLASDSRNNNAGAVSTTLYREYNDITPAILTQPQSQTVASGSKVVFGVTARGLPLLSYQWLFNGSPIGGATASLLTLTGVTTNQVGDYRVVVTNNYGAITSQIASLVVDGVGAGGFEADVMPTPYGNNSVSVSDWTRVGRLVAGLDAALSSSEFQRADCAPRTNALLGTLPLGNASLTVADWTQAGRYAAGLDPLTPAGGPNQPGSLGPRLASSIVPGASLRQVRVTDAKVAAGQTFDVTLELVGVGDENAVGCSLEFDPARLAYHSAALGAGVPGATLQVNDLHAAEGRLGLVLAKSVGQAFDAGHSALVAVRFSAVGETGVTRLTLGDHPVVRELAGVSAEVQSADYLAGSINVVQPAVLSPQVQVESGEVELQLSGQAGETYRVEVSTDLVRWELLSRHRIGSGVLRVGDPNAGQFRQRFYRAVLDL